MAGHGANTAQPGEKWHTKHLQRHKQYWTRKSFLISMALSLLAFAGSVYANYAATAFAGLRASNSVTDLILSNTPVYDVDGFIVYGAFALIIFIAALCFSHPKYVPFTLYSLALFFFIRAGFISLTHLGPYPDEAQINVASSVGIFFSKLFFGDDLFFSGHTGAPFLMALVYWGRPLLRWIFLAWSASFAIAVLLGHMHYSIDVASAFFITYTIYCLAKWAFPHEYELFHESEKL